MVKIKDYVKGDTAISYEDGVRCKKEIVEELDAAVQSQSVILDFEGVSYVITAFLNPIIGDLILERGTSVMKTIQIENANNDIIMKIKMVRDGALLKREDTEDGIF